MSETIKPNPGEMNFSLKKHRVGNKFELAGPTIDWNHAI